MKGQRVFAIKWADEEEVCLYGIGTYEGEEPCEEFYGIVSPKIKLDSGEVVWGYQCWWAPLENYEEYVGGRKVITWSGED